jgi:predicted Zn-dependent peptidase
MNKIESGILKNKMKYCIEKTDCGNNIDILMFVNTGSRDEPFKYRGISHYLEHMLFRGTKKYPSDVILTNELYKLGGSFNAFTDYTSTVYEINVGKKYYDKGLEMIHEILYNSLLREEDFKKEKKVVLNELNLDSLDDRNKMFKKSYNTIYKDTLLEQGIIGTKKTIGNCSVDLLKEYLNTRYNSENIIISVCGDISIKNVKQSISKYFSKDVHYPIKKKYNIFWKDRILYPDFRLKKQNDIIYNHIKNDDDEAYIGIGFKGFSYLNEDEISILEEILVGSFVGNLYKKLRGDKGLIYHIDIDISNYSDCGHFIIYFGTKNEKNRISQCLYHIFKELISIQDGKISKKRINEIKTNIIENYKDSKTDTYERALINCYDLTMKGKTVSIEENIENIRKVQMKELINTAKELFSLKMCNITIVSKSELSF